MLAFQHIMDASSPSKCFDLKIGISVFNQSYYKAQTITTCTDLTVRKLGFSRIIFDKTSI